MSDIPNTENTNVAVASIAWAIVQIVVVGKLSAEENQDELLRKITNAYIKVYEAIKSLTPIEN